MRLNVDTPESFFLAAVRMFPEDGLKHTPSFPESGNSKYLLLGGIVYVGFKSPPEFLTKHSLNAFIKYYFATSTAALS